MSNMMENVFQIHTAHKKVSSLTKSIKNIALKNLAMPLFYWLMEFVPGSILSHTIFPHIVSAAKIQSIK